MVEAAVKMLAFGAFCGKSAYFCDNWNLIDFLIVLACSVELVLAYTDIHISVFRIMRLIRILRLLKLMKSLPSIRKQVLALIKSVSGLFQVLIFMVFIYCVFSVVGLQLFAGGMNYACRVGATPQLGEKAWMKDRE
jgi:hypothetical protein